MYVLCLVALLCIVAIPFSSSSEQVNDTENALLIGDSLVFGGHVFDVHGMLDEKRLYMDNEPLDLDGIVPWWVSGIKLNGELHLVLGDAAYRTYLSHYFVSQDDGGIWELVESFQGHLKPRIGHLDGEIHLMFERTLESDGPMFYKLAPGQRAEATRAEDDGSVTYSPVLDYRATKEYDAGVNDMKADTFGRPPEKTTSGSTRAPAKEWAYIYVCNGEASGIESYLEADADEMALGGSSANHWAICLFDDDVASTDANQVRVMDEGGGGGYTAYTMADVGLPAEPNLGDPDTYVTFLDWCFTNYPAENVVWDNGGHGGGTDGCIYDENPVDKITLTEVTYMADQFMTTLGRPINITSWDTCITMTQEWVYSYKPCTDFTVASTDNIVGAGFDYTNLMGYLASNNPTVAEMAHEIANDYWTGESAYISTVDMDNWDYTFWPTFNKLCQELRHGSYSTEINNAWSNAFYPGTAPNHDVWEWMDNLASSISDPTIQSLALQARDEVWTANYPSGLNDAVQVEYGSSTSHHGLGDEEATNSAWQIDIETMRDEMITQSGVSNAIPACTISNPTEGMDVPMDGIFTIQGSASDSDGSVSKVEVKINKEWWQLATGTGSWSFDWDVTSDVAYYGIGPYKVWARSFDGTDYSDWQCVNVNVVESYGSAGAIKLDRELYAIEDTVMVTVTDGDLTVNKISITVDSNTEPSGETFDLFETATQGKYEGTITISATNSNGVLQASHGDTITATYDDADDGTGSPAVVTDTATVDGQVQPASGLTVQWFGIPSQTLIDEDFSSGVPPTDWSEYDPTDDWSSSTTSNAGGSSPEARFTWYNGVDVWRLYSGPVDTSGMPSVNLQFQHLFDDYSASYPVRIKVQTSSDGSTWHDTSWYMDSSANQNIGPELVTVLIDTVDVGSATFRISFTVEGNAYGLDNWYVDDALLTYTGGGLTDDNKLDWTLSADDGAGANDVDHYDIYRADNSGGPWDAAAIIDTVAAGTSTYIDYGKGEIDGITWWYVVRAVDLAGNVDANTNSVPEPSSGNQVPNAPLNPVPADAAAGVGTSPTLSVDVTDPDGDPMDVAFYDASGPTLIGTQNGVASGGTASVTWSGLSESTTYQWYAVANDGEFDTASPTWSFTTIDTTPPAQPTILTVEHWGTSATQDVAGGRALTLGAEAGTYAATNAQDNVYHQLTEANAGGPPPTPLQGYDITYDLTISGGTTSPYTLYIDAYVASEACDVSYQVNGGGYALLGQITATSDTDTYLSWALSGVAASDLVQLNIVDNERTNGEAVDILYVDHIYIESSGGGAATDHNTVNWTLSTDDGGGANDVAEYRVYRSEFESGPWDESAHIVSVPAGTTTYTDIDMGLADVTYWWYVVRANDTSGNLDGNSVSLQEPGGAVVDDVPLPVLNLSISVDGSNNPVLTWDLQAEPLNRTRSEVRVFRSADRNTWTFAGDLVYTAGVGDLAWTDTGVSSGTYYYYVRPYNFLGLSGLSTMGVYHAFSFTYNAGIGNDNWISLPMNSSYAMASDIVLAIEGALSPGGVDQYINYIGKWDPATQGVTESFFYQEVGPPALWGWNGGSDFAINPGDSITIQLSGNTPSFTWSVAGTDVRCTKSFTYNAGIGNDNWITVPWTGQYAMASDVVLALEGALSPGGVDVYVNYIGKWDPATQGVTESFFYQEVGPPALWGWNGGADFAINPGDGITIQLSGNTANFNWQMALVSNPVPDNTWP